MTNFVIQLSLARTQRRAEWEASQAINPTDLVGTCPDMCPEYERHEREAHFDIPGGNLQSSRIDHSRAVKKYHRPAAGNEAPLPEDVRPTPVLRKTMDYLLNLLDDLPGETFSDKHKFLRDRTRAIRQDITLQHRAIRKDAEAFKTVVYLHEEMARFHILSGHRLCELEFSEFDPFQNTEQLRKVLQSLHEYYSDIRLMLLMSCPSSVEATLREALRNESEFRSYQLLSHAEDQDVFRQSLTFPAEVFASCEVKLARDALAAFHSRDYIRYFQLVRTAPYLMACLMQTHFIKLRESALHTIIVAFSSRETISMATLRRWLLLEEGVRGQEELQQLVRRLGKSIKITISPTTGEPQLEWTAVEHEAEVEAENIAMPVRPLACLLIEAKVQGLECSKIIRRIGEAIPPSSIATKTVDTIQPLPSKRIVNIEEIGRILLNDLLGWFVRKQLPILVQQAITDEQSRRKVLRQTVISRGSNQLVDGLLGEFIKEAVLEAIKRTRTREEARQYRTCAIERISEKVCEDLIRGFVRNECRYFVRNALRSNQGQMENLLQLPTNTAKEGLRSASPSPPPVTPLKKHRSSRPSTPFRLEQAFANLRIFPVDEAMAGGSTARKFDRELERLKRATAEEKEETRKLEKLVNQTKQ